MIRLSRMQVGSGHDTPTAMVTTMKVMCCLRDVIFAMARVSFTAAISRSGLTTSIMGSGARTYVKVKVIAITTTRTSMLVSGRLTGAMAQVNFSPGSRIDTRASGRMTCATAKGLLLPKMAQTTLGSGIRTKSMGRVRWQAPTSESSLSCGSMVF